MAESRPPSYFYLSFYFHNWGEAGNKTRLSQPCSGSYNQRFPRPQAVEEFQVVLEQRHTLNPRFVSIKL